MGDLIFCSDKAKIIFNQSDGDEYYIGSDIVVSDRPIVLDLYASSNLDDIRIYLVKSFQGMDKIVTQQPHGNKIGLGTLESGIFDCITVSERGSYKLAMQIIESSGVLDNVKIKISAS